MERSQTVSCSKASTMGEGGGVGETMGGAEEAMGGAEETMLVRSLACPVSCVYGCAPICSLDSVRWSGCCGTHTP